MDAHADVAIAGAGIAGLTLAYQLARRGRRVVVVDAASEPSRAGASWVNGVEKTLFHELDLGRPDEGVIFGRPTAFTMQSPLGARVRCSPVPTQSIDMRGLAAWMLRLAREAGADVRFGERVTGVLADRQRVAGVAVTSGDLTAPLTVDAAGLAGPVRTRLPPGAWDDPEPDLADADLALAHQEVRTVRDVPAARRYLAAQGLIDGETLSTVSVAGGYSTLNVEVDLAHRKASFLSGCKLDAQITARQLILDLVAKLGFLGERVFGGGGKIPLRRSYDLLVGEGWALCGDAGCQVFPSHGSGVAAGMIAGSLLAEVADRALGHGDLSRAALWPYAARWQRGRGATSAAHDLLRRFSETLTAAETERLIGTGLLGEAEILQSLACAKVALDPRAALLRAPGMLRPDRARALPWLLRRFLPATRRSMAAQKHYERFPQRWDEAAFRTWQRGASALFAPATKATA
jgi:flavin-dependent dehydrogenase